MTEKISFFASFPPIGSAYNIDGREGEGARIKLDVPGTDVEAILQLVTGARGKLLRVTVEVEE